MTINKIDERFATSGQIRPEEVARLAEQGYTAIVCARPDNEEQGQPGFADIAREAEKHGMTAIHIPFAGAPTPEHIARFNQAMADVKGPVLGYCRGGGRAAALYGSSEQQA